MGFHLVLASIFLIASTYTCSGAENITFCNEKERLGLLKFRVSVYDGFRMLSSWEGKDCCLWKGVSCDAATGSILGLRLRGQNIWNSYYFPESNPADDADDKASDNEDYYPVGEDCYLVGNELNSSLAELRNLKYLDLSGNDFRMSQIPEFIGSLKHLTYLNLSNAGFRGIIPPHIGNLSNLEVLDLSARNQDLMTDSISWVYSLSLLKHLNLNGVDHIGTQIDMVLYMIPSLVELSLSHCSLTNAHTSRYLNLSRTLPNIRYLDLSKNFLNDQLPSFLQNLTSLAFLDISNSDFSLPLNLPGFINMMPSLSDLHLSRCELRNRNLSPTNHNFSVHANIQHLDLSRNSIEGSFPSVLTNISSLKDLDLHNNFLNSSIPVMPNLVNLDISGNNFTDIDNVGIWRQCHLKQLSVSRNYLKGQMIGVSTNISECSKYCLEELHLDHNQLSGSIPESLTSLTNLRVLDLSSNKLINLIPESLERLRILQVLDLSENQLNGRIPISIGQLSNLKFLNVSNNHLEGIILESHFAKLLMLMYLDISFNTNLTLNVSQDWIPMFSLTTIQLSSCKIIDKFPQWLRTQRNLKKLVLSNTSLSGPLPTWFEQMPAIPHLDLSHNKLTGTLTNLPIGDSTDESIYKGSLLLLNNLFNGPIPNSLCRRTALEILDLSNNRLTGNIPTCLGKLQKLRAMILSNNSLSGVIPSSIGKNSLLSWLHLNGNNFTGDLPPDMGNLHGLWVLDLGNNDLSGKIPEWIAELTELTILRLYKNNFTGRIPPSLCKNACLQILDVAHNNLKGPIPQCIGEIYGKIDPEYCRHYLYSKEKMVQVINGQEYTVSTLLSLLVNVDLSSNELEGTIPEELTSLSGLRGLNFSHNHLYGNIPHSIGNMRMLESVDFSMNKLTGMIPPSMVDLEYVSYLNFSYNNLSGRIPTGAQLDTFDASSYAANEDLCGPPVRKICTNPIPTKKNNYKKLWFYLDVMSGFATGFWGVVGALLFNKKWRNEFYRLAQLAMDNIYVAVAVKLNKMK